MKKIICSLFISLGLAGGTANAQYDTLHTFQGPDGAYPEGSLIASGKTLFGMTQSGGANDSGCIFSMDTLGHNFKAIFSFGGLTGAYPASCILKMAGHKLYGMTPYGGTHDSGCIFSIDTNGAGFKVLLDFSGTKGAIPYGSLTLAGNKMFGMTYTGGAHNLGLVFTIDTNGHNYKDLYDFSGGVGGGNPPGDLTIIKDKLFGTTYAGANGDGNLFSIDSNGANYTDLFDFNGTNGQEPTNVLTYSGTKFLGMTYQGGAHLYGTVYSIDTNGTRFKELLSFDAAVNPFGQYPHADVILINSTVYGTTYNGGASAQGCIFSIDSTGSSYTDIYNFSPGADGYNPPGDLTSINNSLYGTTYYGGKGNLGVVFKVNKADVAGINNLKNQAAVNIYPNPSNGIFNFACHSESAVADEESLQINVYNVLGENVMTETLHSTQGDNLINLSSQPNGIYLYRILSNTGELMGEGKMVIQK